MIATILPSVEFVPPSQKAKPSVTFGKGWARLSGNRMMMGKVILAERKPSKRPHSRALHRLSEVECVIRSRHGNAVPETDDADVYIEVAAYALNAHAAYTGSLMEPLLHKWVRRWASWALDRHELLEHIISNVSGRIHNLSADKAAESLRVSIDERQALELRTIGAFDVTPAERKQIALEHKRAKDRTRQQRKRRAAGVVPRDEFEANSLSSQTPWKAEGISRRTWERRRAKNRYSSSSETYDASPSRIDIDTISDTLPTNETAPTIGSPRIWGANASTTVPGEWVLVVNRLDLGHVCLRKHRTRHWFRATKCQNDETRFYGVVIDPLLIKKE